MGAGDIETIEDFEFFMETVYKMNPESTEEEIDDRIHEGMKSEGVARS